MATTQNMYFEINLSSFLSVICGLLKALGKIFYIINDNLVGFNGISWSINGYIFGVIECTNLCFVFFSYHSRYRYC